ncbi:MAG: acyltransferase family protein [Methanoregula sp.]|nr:acyltransferase family protein [Methanoregula sp.]
MKENLFALDFLRALAIVCIIVTHLAIYLISNPFKLFFYSFIPYFADIGLGLFLFISGYLMYHNNPTLSSAGDVLKFYKKRVLRVFPLYWIAIVLFVIVFAWLNLPTVYSTGTSSEMFSLTNIIITALGLQIFLSPSYAIPIFTLYFVGVILLCYYLYPLIIYYSKNFSSLVCSSALIFLLFIFLHVQFNIIGNQFFLFYPIFISGIAVRYLSLNTRSLTPWFLILLPVFLVLLLIIESRTTLIFDERVMITIKIPDIGFVSQDSVNQVLLDLGSRIGISLDTLKLIIINILFDLFIIAFCITQLIFSKQYADYIQGSARSFIMFLSVGSYGVYLFHDPLLTIWTVEIESWIYVPIVQDLLTIFLIVPLIFIVSYYFQSGYSSVVEKKILR